MRRPRMRVWDGLTKPGPPPEQTQCAKAGGETSVLASFIEAGCLLLPQKRTLTGLADDMRRKPYVERTATLRKLLRGDRGIQYVEQAEEHGEKLFTAVCKLGLEGIVSKKLDSLYRSGASKTWIRIKNPKAPAATRAIDGTF